MHRSRRLTLSLWILVATGFSSPWASGQNCQGTSVGFVPLTDLGPGTYQGFGGGLYPAGSLARPAAHDAAGLTQAAAVVPRDAAGNPDPSSGIVVLLSIGLSNTTQEFQAFQQIAQSDPDRDPRVVLVDGAQGGWAAEDIVNPNAAYWTKVDQRLAQAGASPFQVQVVWIKTANRSPSAPFPQHAQTLQGQLETIVQIIRSRYPNTRLGYFSSRIYAGYATTPLNPEPWAYESGFSVKWLLQDQIGGNPALNFDPAVGSVVAPWLAWGPYLWADGLVPRSDLLVWKCSDFESDGTHPGPAAEQTVANFLSEFFKTDATAKTWYLAQPTTLCGPQANAGPYGSGTGGPNGIASLVASRIPTVPTLGTLRVHVWGAPSAAGGAMVLGLGAIPTGQVPMLGGWLLVQPAVVLGITTDGNGQAGVDLGAVPDNPQLCGLDLFAQAVVQDADSPNGFDVTRGLRVHFGH